MKTITTQGLFQLIKQSLFPDINVEAVLDMTQEEQNTFLLEQLERLFSGTWIQRDAPLWLSDLFWTAAEGRKVSPDHYNPFLDPVARMQMTDEERLLCSFYVTLAGLCHDLALHYPFDPLLLGIENANEDFLYSNEPLRGWFEITPFVHVAAHMAWIMRNATLRVVTDYYQPAQDYLAEIRLPELGILNPNDLKKGRITPQDFSQAVLKRLKTLDDHVQEGARLGYCDEEIILHDELVGRVTDYYVEWMPDLVHELYHTLQKNYEELDFSDLNPDLPLRKQPLSVSKKVEQLTRIFINKVREWREKHELRGWFEDDSLEFGYLIDHVQFKVYGRFN